MKCHAGGNNERDGSDRGWRNNDRDRRDGRAAESSSFGGRGTSGFGQGSGTVGFSSDS